MADHTEEDESMADHSEFAEHVAYQALVLKGD